jgi:hypothetical protein
MVAEEFGLKEITNFSQELLQEDGVYILDFESEAFIWVGKRVPHDFISDVFDKSLVALRSIHKCGTYRLKQLTLNLVF